MPRLSNGEIADVFHEMADLTQIVGGDQYRIRAFRRSARVIENLPEPVEKMIRFGSLGKVPGLGDGSVHRCKQILRTGTCDDHRELRAQLPPGLRDMLEVKGVGAKTVRLLWQSLRIGSVDDLERAARVGELRKLPRMGELTEERILAGISAWRTRISRVPLFEALRVGGALVDAIRDVPQALRVELAGSARRRKATIGDLDILVAAENPGPVAERFTSLPQVQEVILGGDTRVSVRLNNRQQADLRVIPPHNFGAGMHYFTGSKLHNIAIRERANRHQFRISEHGVFRRSDDRLVSSGEREEDIFTAVGLPWIPPELRENIGEIEAADQGRLPRLITAEDLRGDLHMHTDESDGVSPARDMAEAAIRLGHEYIAITDHSKTLAVANGLDEERVRRQIQQLRKLQDQLGQLRILAGNEVDILPDGSLDLDPRVLRDLDWVVASVHSEFDMDETTMTDRVVRAMESGLVDCLGHPTGRRLGEREGYRLDWERVLQAARRTDTALEVNGNPRRMDLDAVICKQAKEYRVPLVLNTDAHAPWHLEVRQFALASARRGWLEPRDVLNTQPVGVIEDRRGARMRKRGIPVVSVAEARGLPLSPSAATPARTTPTTTTTTVADAAAIALASRLTGELDDELRARVQRFMERAEDPELEAALAHVGPNPLQAAFNLLLKPGDGEQPV